MCVVFNVTLHVWHGNLQYFIQWCVKFRSSLSSVAQITVSVYKSNISYSQSTQCVDFKKFFFICDLSASSSSDIYFVLGYNAVRFYRLMSTFRRNQWAKVYVVTSQKVIILLLWTVVGYHYYNFYFNIHMGWSPLKFHLYMQFLPCSSVWSTVFMCKFSVLGILQFSPSSCIYYN
jgi:hypothetical protein